jgi:hypothetical protein
VSSCRHLQYSCVTRSDLIRSSGDTCRLRDAGLVFSDIPTAAEIEAIQKERDLKKEMEGMDEAAVIDGSRKRSAASAATASSAAEEAKAKPKRTKIAVDDEEEEADL